MRSRRTITSILLLFLISSLLLTGCGGDLSAGSSSDPAESYFIEIPTPLLPTDEPFLPPITDEPSGEDREEPPLVEIPIVETPTQSLPEEERRGEQEAESAASTRSEYDTYKAACASANVNVRAGAGTTYAILLTLKRGESLPYLGTAGEWLMVETERGVGYIYNQYAYLAETSAAIERVILAGIAKLNTPYLWGAPRILTGSGTLNPYFTGKSFDCSSFVQYCYYVGCGIKLGNYTGSQADYTVGTKISSYAALRRGDFYFTGTDKISHVVIYLGGGYLLQTYSANGGPVSITTDDRWRGKFISGRRPDLTVVDQYN